MIEVREARPADADACAAAHIQAWRAGYRHLLPDEFLDAPEFASQRLDRWRAWTWSEGVTSPGLFVAEVDDRVIGFGMCGAERAEPVCDQLTAASGTAALAGRGEVYAFYLHPDAWGSGAAAPLIERCQHHLRSAGFHEAVLWVLRDNPRALRFYERSGWMATGRAAMFEGPRTAPKLSEPLPEIEYLRQLF
ncbi:MAG: GNAT family N-acetyltransferase [Ilumatobacteraceae bacterium]